jgi:hypothetical protein
VPTGVQEGSLPGALTQNQGVKYQLFHPNGPRDQTLSAGTTVLQAYGRHVLDSDDTETARAKIETEIRRLPTATWEWLNQSDTNPLGDLRVWQVLPGISNRCVISASSEDLGQGLINK